jgi:general secretion pathway protein D
MLGNLVRHTGCILFVIGMLLMGNVAYGAGKPVQLNFQDVELRKMVKVISAVTGKTFVVDPRVKGRATIYSSQAVGSAEVYKIFQSVLEVHGYTIVSSGHVLKIVPAQTAKGRELGMSSGKRISTGVTDRVITHIVALEHTGAERAAASLKGLTSPQGSLAVHAATNLLIITDYQSNVRRLLKIIENIDRDIKMGVHTLVLRHGAASEVATKSFKVLNRKLKKLGKRGIDVSIEADTRSNSVVISAPVEQVGMVVEVVKAFDRPTARGRGGFRHIALRNAKAEDVAKVLTDLVQRKNAGKRNTNGFVSGELRVVADKATNSLLISASAEDFAVLQDVVCKLDIKRRQVYVEAIVLETTSNAGISYGVNWGFGKELDVAGQRSIVFGGTNLGISKVPASEGDDSRKIFQLPAGLTAGLVTFPLKLGGLEFGSLQSLINLSQTSSDYTVLATPQLMTMDNEKAKVVVAENIPFSTKLTLGTSTSDASQSFQYKDVGFVLEILPQISEGGKVRLKIHQEVSRIIQSSVESDGQVLLAPKTQRRELDTTVQIQDGDTVVLAGLLSKEKEDGENGVPFLSDIPVLGHLFKRTSDSNKKTNLMLFLHPRIITTEEQMRDIYNLKRQYLEEARLGKSGMPEPILLAPCADVPQLPSVTLMSSDGEEK